MAPTHQSAAWVFGDWDPTLAHLLGNAGGGGGLGPKWTPAYGAMLGLLFAAYTFTGYDGPAHSAIQLFRLVVSTDLPTLLSPVSEETKNAAVATPRGVLCGFLSCAISGWAFAIACCFSIKNAAPGVSTISGLESSTEAGHGYNAFSQILYDAFQNRYGNGQIGTALMALPLIGTWLCEVSILMYVARILFAYSRDDGVPFSRIWKQVHPVTKTPLNAVWGTALIAVAVGLTYLRSSFAINAILSLSVIALNVSYVTPVIIRCTVGRKRFRKGPWNLGVLAYPFCAIATLWVGFAVCVFSLPQAYPVTFQNLNVRVCSAPPFGVAHRCVLLLVCSVFWGLLTCFSPPLTRSPCPSVRRPLLRRRAVRLPGVLVLSGQTRRPRVVQGPRQRGARPELDRRPQLRPQGGAARRGKIHDETRCEHSLIPVTFLTVQPRQRGARSVAQEPRGAHRRGHRVRRGRWPCLAAYKLGIVGDNRFHKPNRTTSVCNVLYALHTRWRA